MLNVFQIEKSEYDYISISSYFPDIAKILALSYLSEYVWICVIVSSYVYSFRNEAFL